MLARFRRAALRVRGRGGVGWGGEGWGGVGGDAALQYAPQTGFPAETQAQVSRASWRSNGSLRGRGQGVVRRGTTGATVESPGKARWGRTSYSLATAAAFGAVLRVERVETVEAGLYYAAVFLGTRLGTGSLNLPSLSMYYLGSHRVRQPLSMPPCKKARSYILNSRNS